MEDEDLNLEEIDDSHTLGVVGVTLGRFHEKKSFFFYFWF